GLLGALRHRLVGPARTLNHRYGDVPPVPEPWRHAPVEQRIEADFAIVGGGVAGLAAAVTASAEGRSAVLIERSPRLGGAIDFFGAVEGEARPETTLAELEAGLDGKLPVTRLLGAEAFAIEGATVLVHQVVVESGRPRSRVVAIAAGNV